MEKNAIIYNKHKKKEKKENLALVFSSIIKHIKTEAMLYTTRQITRHAKIR